MPKQWSKLRPFATQREKYEDGNGAQENFEIVLPMEEPPKPSAKELPVEEVLLSQIEPNPFQPRRTFAEEELKELSESILRYGLLQPIMVRQTENGYQIVSGERRYRAAKLAGLEHITAVVRTLSDSDMAEMAMVENLQRSDLDYFEEAEGYARLMQEFHLTQEELAKKMGKTQSTIANKLRLLQLSPQVRKFIDTSKLTERHVRAILPLKNEDKQLSVLTKVYAEGLNVRQCEDAVNKMLAEEEKEAQKYRKRRMMKAIKDMRIFLNTIDTAVQAIREAGLPAEVKESEYEEYVEVIIKLPKAV